MSGKYESLKALYESANQAHVFTFYSSLTPSEQSTLLHQLDTIDPVRVNKVHAAAIEADAAAKNASADEIEPLPTDVLESLISSSSSSKSSSYYDLGINAIADGRVAVLLMAGGQGTRLGSSDPKGCYDIGLPSHKSLFQLQAERIRRLQTVAEQVSGKKPGSVKIRWYIMTSEPTHDATRAFFGWGKDGEKLERGGAPVNFGLEPDQVVFFKQGNLNLILILFL